MPPVWCIPFTLPPRSSAQPAHAAYTAIPQCRPPLRRCADTGTVSGVQSSWLVWDVITLYSFPWYWIRSPVLCSFSGFQAGNTFGTSTACSSVADSRSATKAEINACASLLVITTPPQAWFGVRKTGFLPPLLMDPPHTPNTNLVRHHISAIRYNHIFTQKWVLNLPQQCFQGLHLNEPLWYRPPRRCYVEL